MTILSFEPLRSAHAEFLFTPLSDPRLYTYLPEEPPSSIEALTTQFSLLARGSESADEQWLNWVSYAGPEPVGTLQATVQADKVALIAYIVFVEHQQKGYAVQGCRWMLASLARMNRVSVIRALIDTRNVASIRLVEALGLQRVSVIPSADHFKGASSDEFVYEVAVSEIRNSPAL